MNSQNTNVYTVTYYRFMYSCEYCQQEAGELHYNHTTLGVFTSLDDAKSYSEQFLHTAAKCVEHNTCGYSFSLEKKEEEECKAHNIPYTECYYCSQVHQQKNCRMCEENNNYIECSIHEEHESYPLQLNTFVWQINEMDPDLKMVFSEECHPAICIQILPFVVNTQVDYLSSFHHTDSIFDDLTFTSFKSWLYSCYSSSSDGNKCCIHKEDNNLCLSKEHTFKYTRKWHFDYLQEELIQSNLYTRDMKDILRYVIYPFFFEPEEPEDIEEGEEEDELEEETESELEEEENDDIPPLVSDEEDE